ncbi:hypothetical protein [Paenibacillus glycinis]|uniref:Uncharacterized protein n=1 Tax=Paenibacillus glycinis TaxID=2697035 RepID=A0ABW9XNI1_9BACL|nr:hypothetical protein [Paenibacillus glycinis]NBD24195.1 hypothetical protein [Paenibacillus glycinis]
MEYSIGAYKHKDGTILLIPFAFDQDGVRRNLNIPRIYKLPYDLGGIGHGINECLEFSKMRYSLEDLMQQVFKIVTGEGSYSKFSKNRLRADVILKEKIGYSFEPMKRCNDGSYEGMEKEEKKIEKNLQTSNIDLGESLLKVFELCR